MPLTLLWIANLGTAALLSGLLAACIGRLYRPGWRRVVTWILLGPVWLAACGLLGFAAGSFTLWSGGGDIALIGVAILLVGFVLTSLVLIVRAQRAWGGGWSARPRTRKGGSGGEKNPHPSLNTENPHPNPLPGKGEGTRRRPLRALALAVIVAVGLHLLAAWSLDRALMAAVEDVRRQAQTMAMSIAPARIPDERNAAVLYRQAFAMLEKDGVWDKLDPWFKDRRRPAADDPQLRKAVADLEPMYVLLARGAAMPECYFDRDYANPRVSTPMPELGLARAAAQFVRLHAFFELAKGPPDAAAADAMMLLRMAQHFGGEGNLTALLIGVAIQDSASAILQEELAAAVPSAENLRQVRLEGLEWTKRLYERSFWSEQALCLLFYADMAGPEGRYYIRRGAGSDQGFLGPIAYRYLMFPGDVAQCGRLMAQYRALHDRDYVDALPQIARMETGFSLRPGGRMMAIMAPAMGTAFRMVTVGQAKQRLLGVALALAGYRAAEGKYPQTLGELVPRYMPVLPADPFDGQALRWKTTAEGPVVYSVGPDLKDNGGAPYDEKKGTGDLVFRMHP